MSTVVVDIKSTITVDIPPEPACAYGVHNAVTYQHGECQQQLGLFLLRTLASNDRGCCI